MIELHSANSAHILAFSEPFFLREGGPMLRFRLSFQMSGLPYATTWVPQHQPESLVHYFHKILRLVREPDKAVDELQPTDLYWRSDEGHLLLSASFQQQGMLLHCKLCTVPKHDPKGVSMTLSLTDSTLTAFLTELAHFFSVQLPAEAILPSEDWDDDPPAATRKPLRRKITPPTQDDPAEDDVWKLGQAPADSTPLQVDLDGWDDD